jgi:hypothetical protein
MIYVKRLNLCFIEIPKTASKAIRNFIVEEMANPIEDVFNDGINMHETHYNSRYIIRNKLAPSNAKFIGVIREPLERQLSAYIFSWRRLLHYGYIKEPIEPSLEHFKEIYQTSVRPDGRPGFWEFMNKMGSESQSSYINRGLNHEFWLYENLENHIEDFKKEYNIRPDAFLKKINITNEDETVTTKSLIDKFYDDELKDIMKKQYADDFKLYNELKNARSAR